MTGENLKVEVVGLNRVKGKHLLARIRLSNTGTEEAPVLARRDGRPHRPLGEIKWASGIGVLDAQARTWAPALQTRQLPLPVQRRWTATSPARFIDPGQSISVFAVLPAPSGNPATTTVVTPVGPPMLDVPISDEGALERPAKNSPTPMPNPSPPSPAASCLPSESLDQSEETADDGKDLQVNLSA